MLDVAIDSAGNRSVLAMVHSDRGGHYRQPSWLNRVADAKLIRSMSRKGVRKTTLHARASSVVSGQ